jgi:hypothetical protein
MPFSPPAIYLFLSGPFPCFGYRFRTQSSSGGLIGSEGFWSLVMKIARHSVHGLILPQTDVMSMNPYLLHIGNIDLDQGDQSCSWLRNRCRDLDFLFGISQLVMFAYIRVQAIREADGVTSETHLGFGHILILSTRLYCYRLALGLLMLLVVDCDACLGLEVPVVSYNLGNNCCRNRMAPSQQQANPFL